MAATTFALASLLSGARWLCTAFLLTPQPTVSGAARRWLQRVVGGTVGASLAAAVLPTFAAPALRSAAAGVPRPTALPLRRRAHPAWAVASPPALWLVDDVHGHVDAVDGAIRSGLTVPGAPARSPSPPSGPATSTEPGLRRRSVLLTAGCWGELPVCPTGTRKTTH